MEKFWLLLGAVVLLAALGVAQELVHRRNLRRIPIRIHVNGTRGKSSVTRLIAAGLRAGGIVTCAKTTGTLPRMILPDGSEYPVFRPSRPNVIEQVRVVRTALAYGTRALVVECMAVQPQLQALSDRKLIRATHAVITNAREDHLDVMGPREEDVALALAGVIPPGGKLFTAERKHLAVFADAARDRNCALIVVDENEARTVTPDELAGFGYIEHAENVALALRVCADFGVERAVALRGMWRAQPDPGVMSAHEIDFFGRRIHFVNGFAANDPESTEKIWRLALGMFPDAEHRIALFNCRADRADRSLSLGAACVKWPPADHYVLMGSGTYIFARAATRAGLDARKLYFAEDYAAHEIFEAVISLAGRSTLVMGMGNIGGQGLEVVQHFRNRAVIEGAA